MCVCVCVYVYLFIIIIIIIVLAGIPLTLSGHSSLSPIASGRFSRLHPCPYRAVLDKFLLVV